MVKNSFGLGCALGCVCPTIAYVLVAFSALAWTNGNPLGVYAVAALLNLVLVRYMYRNDGEKTAQGIILITFVALLILLTTRQITI